MTAIQASDVKIRLASATGPGNSTAAGAAGTSLGRFMSTTDVTASNLFPDISGADNANSKADYQVVFVYNSASSAVNSTGMQNVVVWINGQAAGGADVTIWQDTTGIVDYNSNTAQTVTAPADRFTAPAGSSATQSDPGAFAAAATVGAGINIGTLGPQKAVAIWVRRKANNTAALANDNFTLQVEFDTSA